MLCWYWLSSHQFDMFNCFANLPFSPFGLTAPWPGPFHWSLLPFPMAAVLFLSILAAQRSPLAPQGLYQTIVQKQDNRCVKCSLHFPMFYHLGGTLELGFTWHIIGFWGAPLQICIFRACLEMEFLSGRYLGKHSWTRTGCKGDMFPCHYLWNCSISGVICSGWVWAGLFANECVTWPLLTERVILLAESLWKVFAADRANPGSLIPSSLNGQTVDFDFAIEFKSYWHARSQYSFKYKMYVILRACCTHSFASGFCCSADWLSENGYHEVLIVLWLCCVGVGVVLQVPPAPGCLVKVIK